MVRTHCSSCSTVIKCFKTVCEKTVSRYYFDGVIDELKIYDAPLSADEIETIYQEEVTLLSSEAELISFSFPNDIEVEEKLIDQVSQSIAFRVLTPYGISSLPTNIEISPGASIVPPSGQPQDFTVPVSYTITSEDLSTTNTWTVNVELIEEPLAVTANPQLSSLKVFPNPTTTALHVEYSGILIRDADALLYNVNGQLMRKARYSKDQVLTLSTADLVPGLYFLHLITADDQKMSERVVVK